VYGFSYRRSGFGVRHAALCGVLVALLGCEAELRLEGVEATLAKPIRRTDQFLALEAKGDDQVVAFADNGVIVEAAVPVDGDTPDWQRTELADPAPTFIGSTRCADGTIFALSFGNQLWSESAAGWRGTAIPTEEQLQTIECNAAGDVWVAGAFGTLMRSSDQGQSWEDFSLYEDFTLTAMAFANGTTGYAVGEFGTVVKTLDGGETWEMISPIADDFYPLAAHFSTPTTGWVSGVLGLIWRTDDGGDTWYRETTESQASIYGFIDAGTDLFAFGDLGALLRFEPDEGAWVAHPSPEIPVHYASGIALKDSLLLVGGWGVVAQIPYRASSADAELSRTQGAL